jgi:UDP:flavonoid glycosyltransferase YjiC (YdhE family)
VARFLTTVWPVPGHLHPNLAVAHALRDLGHDVAFYTGQKARGLVEGEGFICLPFQRVNEARVDELLRILGAPVEGLRDLARRRGLWQEWFVGTVPDQLADFEDLLARWRPDVIVCDPAMWGPILVLRETTRIPVAAFNYLASCLIPGEDAPLLAFSLPRPTTWPGRIELRLLRRLVAWSSRSIPQSANAVRVAHGLLPLKIPVAAYAGQMDLYLQQSTPEFDYQRRDLPATVHYVGPCPWDRATAAPPPAFLTELPRNRPWVYVTDGTMHLEPTVTRATLEGLKDLPVQLIVTTGSHHRREDLGPIPPNAWVEEFIPHTELFPLLDAIVTTGGTGTVLKALRVGVPLITVPVAWDQGENAWRLVEAGAGLRLSQKECTPEHVRAAVQRVLGDPSFKRRAQELGASFDGYGGAARAADLLANLAAAKEVSRPWTRRTSS